MILEVENKFRLIDKVSMEFRLKELGAKFSTPQIQRDRYFAHPSRDFRQTDEALRIRQVGEENFVTYKGPKIDVATKTRKEIETPLGPGGASADAFAALLQALGFHYVADVVKTRISSEFLWQGHTVHAAFDHIAGLGDFLELELLAEPANFAEVRQVLLDLAESWNLGSSLRQSYLSMILQQAEKPL